MVRLAINRKENALRPAINRAHEHGRRRRRRKKTQCLAHFDFRILDLKSATHSLEKKDFFSFPDFLS